MKNSLERAVIRTLAYADIFDYPLYEEEIWHRLISGSRFPRADFEGFLQQDLRQTLLIKRNDFYFLKNRDEIVQIRKKRGKSAKEKLKKAQKIGGILKLIPTIKMVGVTGNLAVGNCEKDDDIDLLIVTSSGTLWLSRLLATLALELIGQRRHPGQEHVRDKICLNMFLEEAHLKIPKAERDLYTAHEVVQLKPLWDRGRIYQKFLVDNLWVRTHLPNAIKAGIRNLPRGPASTRGKQAVRELGIRNKKTIIHNSFFLLLKISESVCQWLQLWYMRKRRTVEVIRDGVIRFHPQDAREWILKEFETRLKKYPLDK